MDVDVIIDDEPCNLLEREDRPRSHTWPILPPPSIETIPEDVCDGDDAQLPPLDDSNLTAEPKDVEKPDPSPRKNSRKNAWGNLSYADLITQAIQSSPEQRLTLSQIYDWMVRNIPYFKDKGDSTSSAGWKNSIRHNLSLHSRFMRVQNDNNGKSSYWVINPDAKPGKSSRRRSGSVDGAPKPDKAAKRSRSKKLAQSTDDITSLSPSTVRLNRQNHSCENLFNGASPCSSSDSISNMDDFVDAGVASYPFGDSFARPRSTSNVSTQSSINGGHLTPIQSDVDLDDDYIRIARLDNDAHMSADETANLVENMNLGRKVANVADTINLDDSLKMMKSDSHYASAGQFASEKLTRGHSDSFGSGDSGYESPAYFSPPQTQTTLPSAQMAGARLSPSQQMRSISSPVLNNISIKPPPPYYPPAASAGQLRSHAAMYGQRNHMQVPANFYGQQVGRNGQPLSQANCYGIGQLNPAVQAPPVPRLQHLPFGATMNMPNFSQNVCPPSHGMGSTTRNVQLRQQQQNRSMASPYSGESYAPNVTIAPNQSMNNKGVVFNLTMNMCADSQTRSYYGQPQQTSYYGVTMNQDFPSDLDMLQLQGFADQQQLASDIDAIIKSDMGETCLDVTFEPVSSYSLPAHCVSAASSDLAGRPSAVSMGFMAVAGQGWVR